MTRAFGLLAAGFAVVCLASTFVAADSAQQKSEAKVKAIAESTIYKDGKQKVTVTLNVEKDWYIYANPVGNKNFEDNATEIAITAKEKLKVNVVYPPGHVKTEGKTTVKIYKPNVVVEANVQRTPGDTSPLMVTININACRIGKDGKTMECLEQGTIRLTVP